MKEVPALVRYLDNLGRIVLPAEYRNALGLGPQVPVQITPVEDGVLIKPVYGKYPDKLREAVDKMRASGFTLTEVVAAWKSDGKPGREG